MGNWIGIRTGIACLSAFLLAGASIGCQGAKPVQSQRLIEHQALVDFSGLKHAETATDLSLYAALPTNWSRGKSQSGTLYRSSYWKSPSGHTGVGAVYIHLPLPVGADMVVWLAEREYAKKSDDGRMIGRWKDELGRNWFEAENNAYHVRGYAMADGFEAWVVFFGYRTDKPPEPGEIGIAARSAETFVPLVGSAKPPTTMPTTQPTARPQ